MASKSSSLSGRRRPGTSGLDKRTNKKGKIRQSLQFRDIASLPIADTKTISAQVNSWIQFYKKDVYRDAARVELINLILEASGMDFSIIAKDNQDLAFWYPLTKIHLEYYDVDEAECDIISLIGTSAVREYNTMRNIFPNMKTNIKTFWDCFIKQSQNEISFFDTLNECMKYNITLACQLPRGYNKTPMLMALQTMSSLVFIAKAQGDEAMKAVSNMRALEKKMAEYFQGFFLRIYNNEDEEIKLSCLQELGKWTNAYPKIFLKPPYQKCFQDSQHTHALKPQFLSTPSEERCLQIQYTHVLASGITSETTSESVSLVSGSSPGLMTVDKPVEFSYEELSKATNDFSIKIGQGGFGSVYYADLQGEKAAIKRMDMKATKEFLAELKVLTHVHHLNLVRLIGYCVKDSLYLVYEYIENGNLSEHLSGSSGLGVLPWQTRMQIALNSARGLEYIHGHSIPAYIHRDIKSANILIDKNFRAKVADFGLAKLSEYGSTSPQTRLMGTVGYIPPEYAQYGDVLLSPKIDVYAFGVVLFELISAKEAAVRTNEYVSETDSGGLVALFETVLSQPDPRENLGKLVDPRLSSDDYSLESVYEVAQLAKACTQENPQLRPSMTSIVARLMTLSSSTEE